MRKNDIVRLEITALTNEGNGIGRFDGMAVFVPMTAVGDIIDCRIVKLKNSYAYGIIDKIVSPSKDRIEPDCSAYSKCGGCVFRHISYEAELRAKEAFVHSSFARIGGFDIDTEPIIGCKASEHYRNKAQLPASQDEKGLYYGFYSQRSHRVVSINDCKIQPELFGEISDFVTKYANEKGISAYNEATGSGILRHIYLRKGANSGEVMLSLVVTKETDAFNDICPMLLSRFPDVKSVQLNINPDRTNVILGRKDICLYGEKYINDIMCGNEVKISPHSFYQVNTSAAETVYSIAKEYASLTGSETLLDLYCGIGTVGLSMADSVSKLIGVEVVSEAVDNAKENAFANGINNAEFICGDAGEIAALLAKRGERPDVIVVDPPRKGCDKNTLDAILEMSPSRLVYVSCDHATAARDARYLADNGYELVKYRPCDMFPRTAHVETVCLISKIAPK